MTDVDALVRNAREHYHSAEIYGPPSDIEFLRHIPNLCDALEEKDREIERLREAAQAVLDDEPMYGCAPLRYKLIQAIVASESRAAREREEQE